MAVGIDNSGGDRDAAVWTSPDGITWSRVPHDEAVFGGEAEQVMTSVTAGGPGLVAVGIDNSGGDRDAAVWTSPDGIAWSRVPHDEAVFGGEAEQVMTSVTAGGPGLVAVGSGGPIASRKAAVWTSPDGIAWSRVPHDEATFGGERGQEISSVTVGGPGLVAVGWAAPGDDHDGAVWTSPDGITWSRVPHDEATFGFYKEISSVTAGGPGLVAVGWDDGTGAVWTSPDGITWSRVPHDMAVFGGGEGGHWMLGSWWMWSVTSGGPGLVAVGSEQVGADRDAVVWTSPDGITWSRVPHDEAVFGGKGTEEMVDVTAGGSILVAVGWETVGDNTDPAVWAAARED